MLRKGDEPIPGYRLEKFLGRGQYGEVWQAIAPGTRAALKFIDLSGKHGMKELRGITRVKEIRHPHLMPITAMWMLDESGNILSNEAFDSVDRLEGINTAPDPQATLAISQSVRPHMLIVAMLLGKKNLEDRLKEAKAAGEAGIPISELLVYMEEAAKGIDFLNRPQHDLGEGLVSIQHCDIKPANIMLMGDAAVVCDFGLARILGSNLQATATGMVGSPAYMSPESIRRKPSLGSDQYSLAISYAELRTGRLPFYDETYAAVLLAHENGTLKLDYLPAAEAAVIRRATALSPADRFPNCAAMVEALRAAVGTSPVLLQPVAEPDEPVRETLEKSAGAPSRETVVKRSTAREFRSPRESTSGERPRSWLAPVVASTALALLCLVIVVSWKKIQKSRLPAELVPAVVGNGGGKEKTGPDVPTLLAEAGKHWAEGRLPESVAAYEQIIKGTRKPKTPADAAARVMAQVGLLRASLRADSPRWDEIAKDAGKLLEPDSKLSPGQRAVARLAQVLAAVQADSESILANMTLRDLAELQQYSSQLEEPERRWVDDLKARALRELSAAETLDEATLTQVAAIWPGNVRLTLLLPRLRKALDASDWPAFQSTLALAQPLAISEEEQGEVAALELQSHLADTAASFPTALAELSRLAEMKVPVASWEEVCERIIARCEKEPALTSQTLAALGKLRASLAEDLQPSAKACWQRLARGVLGNTSHRDALPLPELTQLCVDYQAEDPDDPLVNAVWVECQLRAAEPGVEIPRAQWTAWEETMRAAVAAADKLPSASEVAYVRIVSELLHGRATLSEVRDAAAEALLGLRTEAPELFQYPWRRQMITELLVTAARRQGIPSDLDLPGETDATPSVKAWEFLVAGYQLQKPAPDELIAAMIVAGEHQKLDERQRQWLVGEAARLLDKENDSARTEWLRQQNLAVQLPLAASRLNTALWQEKRDVQYLRAAIGQAARAVRLVFDPVRSDKLMPDVKLYSLLLAPIRPLLDAAESSQLNTAEDQQALGELWGALGQLALRDITTARALGDGIQAEQFAHDALRRAAELAPRAEFFVGQALALMQLPDDGEQERLKQLEDLLHKASALDANSAGVHNLTGYLLTMQSRRQTSREASLALLQSAIDAFKRAVALSDNDDFTSDYWEGLSAANLEAAFYSPRLVKRPFLIAAESAAQTALEFPNRRKPWEAYLKLGNTYEDQAHYLYEKTFPKALAAFLEAYHQATRRGSSAHAAAALFSLGRARARYAASDDIRPDEITSELERAESELRDAIETWEKMPDKKGIQTQVAQARHFVSELLSTRIKRILRPNDPARIELATAAMKESELAAAAAWKARSSIWTLCQLSLVDRTKSVSLLYPAGPQQESWRRKAIEQAQAIIREFESPSLGFRLSLDNLESALQALLMLTPNLEEQIQLVNQHLNKFPDDHRSGSELRFAFAAARARSILGSRDGGLRKKYLELCEQDLEWMEKLAQDLEVPESQQLRTAELFELRGQLAMVEYSESVDPNKLQTAIDLLEKGLEAYGDHHIEESVGIRFSLAGNLNQQLKTARFSRVQKKVVAQRVVDVLKPIEMRHVSKPRWTAIEQYRQAMEAILKESSAG